MTTPNIPRQTYDFAQAGYYLGMSAEGLRKGYGPQLRKLSTYGLDDDEHKRQRRIVVTIRSVLVNADHADAVLRSEIWEPERRIFKRDEVCALLGLGWDNTQRVLTRYNVSGHDVGGQQVYLRGDLETLLDSQLRIWPTELETKNPRQRTQSPAPPEQPAMDMIVLLERKVDTQSQQIEQLRAALIHLQHAVKHHMVDMPLGAHGLSYPTANEKVFGDNPPYSHILGDANWPQGSSSEQ